MSEGESPGNVVLVVCHANVCRSPLAAYGLQDAFARFGMRVQSRGTHARDGMRMCPVSSAALGGGAGALFAEQFRSRRLSDIDLRSPLILTASHVERSIIVNADVSVRPRVFALREAVVLAESDPKGNAELAPDGAALAEWLDMIRRTPRLRAVEDEDFDIPDAHQSRWGSHRRTLRAIEDASRRFARVLQGSAQAM